MDDIFNRKKTVTIATCLFAVILLTFVVSLFLRRPDGDEGMIAEHSYWLQEIGYVKSVMCTGLGFGWESVQYHYHKLFVTSGALLIKVFGIHLDVLRAFVLMCSLLLLYYVHLYYKQDENAAKNKALFAFLLLFFQYHFFYFSFIFRPEIPVACLGFMSFYFLNKYSNVKTKYTVFFAGLLSGASVLMHLNGIVYVLSGVIFLIINKEFKNALYFLVVSSAISLLYFFNITGSEAFTTFLYQFTNDPNLSKSDFSILGKLGKIASEHQRYFHSPKEIVLSLLFFFLLILNFKKLWTHNRNIVIYTFLLLVSLAAVAHDKTDKYSTLYVPFMILIIVQGLMDMKKHRKIYTGITLSLLGLYLVVNSVFISKVIIKHEDVVETNRYYSTLMPDKNTNVLTRENFFFNEIANYRIISAMTFDYTWKRLHTEKPTERDFYEFASQNKAHYILLENRAANKGLLEMLDFKTMKLGENYYGFSVRNINSDFVLLENIN